MGLRVACHFETQRQQSHCVVSFSKTFYSLLSTQVQPRKTENRPDMTEELLTGK